MKRRFLQNSDTRGRRSFRNRKANRLRNLSNDTYIQSPHTLSLVSRVKALIVLTHWVRKLCNCRRTTSSSDHCSLEIAARLKPSANLAW